MSAMGSASPPTATCDCSTLSEPVAKLEIAASGWFNSCDSSDAISPTVARRAVACSLSWLARESSSTRRCSDRSRNALIHPVCTPLWLISGASITSTGKRLPSLRMNTDSTPSRGGACLPESRLSWRLT